MRGACRMPVMPLAPQPKPARAWQRMLSGRRLDLLDPSPLDVEIEDIAHGLARVARWNGQTAGTDIFSVAQHSLLVEAIGSCLDPDLPDAARPALLLHEAPKSVTGAITPPFRPVTGAPSRAVEPRPPAPFHTRFALPPEPSPAVRRLA